MTDFHSLRQSLLLDLYRRAAAATAAEIFASIQPCSSLTLVVFELSTLATMGLCKQTHRNGEFDLFERSQEGMRVVGDDPELRLLAGLEPVAERLPFDAPTAVCCLDEDELDEWWEDLDVEQKSDAFLRFSLKRSTTYVHAAEPAIPILGTANCTAEFEERLRRHASSHRDPAYVPSAADGLCPVSQADEGELTQHEMDAAEIVTGDGTHVGASGYGYRNQADGAGEAVQQ